MARRKRLVAEASFAPVLLLAVWGWLAAPVRAADSNSPPAQDDERVDKSATFFIGSAIDNFAAGDLQKYLNPDASSDVRSFERAIGGIQFAWRLRGGATDDHQLWLYGWTVHGVRSADVDCAKNPDVKVCKGFEDETDPSGRFLYIVRNASSLEAAGGLRWELGPVDSRHRDLARFFLSAQAGFLTVTGTGGDIVDQHHVGFGVVDPTGAFVESYVEIGYGRSDLFSVHPDGRWKLNAFLSWKPEGLQATTAFARIVVDADLGRGADSVQSYFGLRFDLAKLFSKQPANGGKEDSGQ